MTERTQRAALWIAGLLFVLALLTSAWVCDDAWITFRTIARLHAGDGLTWNPGERVQAFTHPAWLFVIALPTLITREFFFTSIAVSVALSLLFAAQLSRWLGVALAPIAILALVASRAFIDFSVSGLENPLQSVLLLELVLVLRALPSARRDLIATGLLSLLFLTRADAVLIAGPLWLVGQWSRRPTWGVIAGALPAMAWELFSFGYYGAWVPNTAIAKLNLDVPSLTLWQHGAAYLVDSLTRDPVTLASVALLGAFAVTRGDRLSRTLVIGAGLSLIYVMRIGGDFMSGRFVVAPFVAVLLAAAHAAKLSSPSPRAHQVTMVVFAASAVLWPHAPLRTGAHFGEGYREATEPEGVIDERAWYYPWAGLLPVLRNEAKRDLVPPYSGACLGREFAHSDRRAQLAGEIGMFGFFAGEKIVIDVFSLADPLLSRIPYRTTAFRAGHYSRPMPAGYLDTRMSGENRLVDEGLRRAWEDLQLVTRGPLFSAERWAALRRLSGGEHRETFERAAANPRTPLPMPPPSVCDDW